MSRRLALIRKQQEKAFRLFHSPRKLLTKPLHPACRISKTTSNSLAPKRWEWIIFSHETKRDFVFASLPILTPEEWLAQDSVIQIQASLS